MFHVTAKNRIDVQIHPINVCVVDGGWNTTDPFTVSVGTAATPVTRMLPIAGKLWCGCHNAIMILNTASLEVEVRGIGSHLCYEALSHNKRNQTQAVFVMS